MSTFCDLIYNCSVSRYTAARLVVTILILLAN